MDYRPGDLRPTGRGQEVVEVSPGHCRNGHRFGPNLVTLGYTPCACGKSRTRGHRTWTCRTCGDITVGDGCTERR